MASPKHLLVCAALHLRAIVAGDEDDLEPLRLLIGHLVGRCQLRREACGSKAAAPVKPAPHCGAVAGRGRCSGSCGCMAARIDSSLSQAPRQGGHQCAENCREASGYTSVGVAAAGRSCTAGRRPVQEGACRTYNTTTLPCNASPAGTFWPALFSSTVVVSRRSAIARASERRREVITATLHRASAWIETRVPTFLLILLNPVTLNTPGARGALGGQRARDGLRLDEHKREKAAAQEHQHHALTEAERGAPLQRWLAFEPPHHQTKGTRGDVRLQRPSGRDAEDDEDARNPRAAQRDGARCGGDEAASEAEVGEGEGG